MTRATIWALTASAWLLAACGGGEESSAGAQDTAHQQDVAGGDTRPDDVGFGEGAGQPDGQAEPADVALSDAPGADTTPSETVTPDAPEQQAGADAAEEIDTNGGAQGSCRAFIEECAPACPTDELGVPLPECRQACVDALSQQGAADLAAYLDCVVAQGCYGFPEGDARTSCEEEKCRAERIGCFHGDQPCAAITTCMNACPPTGHGCLSACISEGTVEAQLAYYAISDCARATCCADDPDACSGAAFAACATASYDSGGACEAAVHACLSDE